MNRAKRESEIEFLRRTVDRLIDLVVNKPNTLTLRQEDLPEPRPVKPIRPGNLTPNPAMSSLKEAVINVQHRCHPNDLVNINGREIMLSQLCDEISAENTARQKFIDDLEEKIADLTNRLGSANSQCNAWVTLSSETTARFVAYVRLVEEKTGSDQLHPAELGSFNPAEAESIRSMVENHIKSEMLKATNEENES